MDKKTKLAGHCKKCGADVGGDQVYCGQCEIELAEESLAVFEKKKQEQDPPVKGKKKAIILGLILVASMVAIGIRLPRVIVALQSKPPIRQGTVETDAQADTCIGNLWHIARLLQEGKLPGNDISCPASGKPYEIIKVGADTLARCPNPQLHGCGELSVSRLSPCPQVEK